MTIDRSLPPSPLGRELYELMRGEPGASVEAIMAKPTLMGLLYIRAEAQGASDAAPSDEAIATAAQLLIEHATSALDQFSLSTRQHSDADIGGAARILLAIEPGTASLLLKDRRLRAADRLHVTVRTMTKARSNVPSWEDRIMRAVAGRMNDREHDFRLREASLGLTRRQPVDSALAVDWLDRYEHYYKIWTAVMRLRTDAEVVLELNRDGDDEINKLEDFVGTSLWGHARFTGLLNEFVDVFGGMWLFADADMEMAVRDAVWFIQQFSPFSHREESRIARLAREEGDLDRFLEVLESGSRDVALLEIWRTRLLSCKCDLDSPDDKCRVHNMIKACAFYNEAVDRDWYKIADWYRAPPHLGKDVTPEEFYRRFGFDAPERPEE